MYIWKKNWPKTAKQSTNKPKAVVVLMLGRWCCERRIWLNKDCVHFLFYTFSLPLAKLMRSAWKTRNAGLVGKSPWKHRESERDQFSYSVTFIIVAGQNLWWCIPGTSIIVTATNLCAPNYGVDAEGKRDRREMRERSWDIEKGNPPLYSPKAWFIKRVF